VDAIDASLAAAGYPGMFLIALVAATLLPAQSELVFVAMLGTGRFDPALLLIVASAGNITGSTINWAIGRHLAHHRGARWFPVSEPAMARAETWYQRFGVASLLLSWLPVVGDPLTFVAGVLRTSLARFLLLVTIAKAGRYLALLILYGHFSN